MAEQFQSARGIGSTTYTCPSGSSALVLGMTVKLSGASTITVKLSSSSIFAVSLPAGTHNLTNYAGKIVLASGENINVSGSWLDYVVISALRLY